jgi:hypothetical protein
VGTTCRQWQPHKPSRRLLSKPPDTLTRHVDSPGLVVWVPVRDGLGQVVNGHLILLTRIYHKVAEVEAPLKRREEGGLDRSHT